MTGASGLEQGYRRLLAWYPGAFRRDHADEILGVLMASAGEGQRRPRLAEAADLLWSGLTMRLRGPALTGESRPWSDALALFSLVAPLFLLLADVLVVALPYRLQPISRFRFIIRAFGGNSGLGGLGLLHPTPSSSGSDLLGSPTPVHLAALFLPPVLFACGTVLAAVTPRRSRLLPS